MATLKKRIAVLVAVAVLLPLTLYFNSMIEEHVPPETPTPSLTPTQTPPPHTPQHNRVKDLLLKYYNLYLSSNASKYINYTLLNPVFKSAEAWYRVQMLYNRYGGHGLVPLRSISPDDLTAFHAYSLEVSEYAAEIPYMYAWMYWLTGNTSWLNRTYYSSRAVWYWSIDGLPLGGCWGVTDPVVYDPSLLRYRVRWYLITWYSHAPVGWINKTGFAEAALKAWRYLVWSDSVYNWTFMVPWEMIYYGLDDIEGYKDSYMEFIHKWLGGGTMDRAPYAYIIDGTMFTGENIVYNGSSAVIRVNGYPGSGKELLLEQTIPLKGNAAYAVVLDLDIGRGPLSIEAVLYNNSRSFSYSFPSTKNLGGRIYITLGTRFLYRNETGRYRLKLRISIAAGRSIEVILHRVGVVALPDNSDYALAPQGYYWGDAVAPIVLSLWDHYPMERSTVIEQLKSMLRELVRWGTDRIFYPPDPRWRFYHWSTSLNDIDVVTIPGNNNIHPASLEETLESLIPVYLVSGDRDLLSLVEEMARWLSHNNYWVGMGYWSLWFGVWTHLWLYRVTGDEYFYREASYYTGNMDEFYKALNEEVSNAAKFIEANIVAYYLTGDKAYLEIAWKQQKLLYQSFVDDIYGWIKPYSNQPYLARHDMLAWTIAPIISLYLGIWVPDWMLWMYPIVYGNSRPNGYNTPINITYTPEYIRIDENHSMYYMFGGYRGLVIIPSGIGNVTILPRDYWPYVISIEANIDRPVSLIAFNSTSHDLRVYYRGSELHVESDTPRLYIIRIGSNVVIRDMDTGSGYYLVKGSYIIALCRYITVDYTVVG